MTHTAQSKMNAPGAECSKSSFLNAIFTAEEGTTGPWGELRAQNNCLAQQLAISQAATHCRMATLGFSTVYCQVAAHCQFLQIHSRLGDRSVFIRRGAEQCNKNLLV